jgi:hypothetical protein
MCWHHRFVSDTVRRIMAHDRSSSDDRATSEAAEDVTDAAGRRRRERAESAEQASRELEGDFEAIEYPVASEDLAIEYADREIEMANETESLGSVFDRLAGEQYDSPEEVREAVYGELTGQAGTMNEANAERDLQGLDEHNPDDAAD